MTIFLTNYSYDYIDSMFVGIVLPIQDLSQVLMERSTVMNSVLGSGERLDQLELSESQRDQHRALHSLTQILYTHLQQVSIV